MLRNFMLCSLFVAFSLPVAAHNGPDPVARWIFDSKHLEDKTLKAHIGPDATVTGSSRFANDEFGQSMVFRRRTRCVVAADYQDISDQLPEEAFTVATWVAIDRSGDWGGIVGTIEDNGDVERGWLLGMRGRHFAFALASQGADDGDGRLTYLTGKSRWEPGRLYHVCGVYDGSTMKLFVNGKLEGTSDEQKGPLLYPSSGEFLLGAYKDANEHYTLEGRLREVRVYDAAAKDEWVRQDFEREHKLTAMAAAVQDVNRSFAIEPYLQFGTQTSMTIMWKTAKPSTSTVLFGEDDQLNEQISSDELRIVHQVTLQGLKPETQYFYLAQSTAEDGSDLESRVSTFTTAVRPTTPFAFAVFGDTQGNPKVSGKLARMAWEQRPSFLVHVGDLVDTGTRDTDWTEQFFPGMRPLISRTAFYPVLGNHERNARNYFDYMALPAPEYHYSFVYGNTRFFMVDSNRNIGPESEQYKWLEKALQQSTDTWKIVCHHHPPYSSDENDYGDLWKVNRSARGDLRARKLVKLYDAHGVDIVWNGHIHSYERTWPLKDGQAVGRHGTMYMITGGGGGGLETPGPFRPWFQHTVRRGHHYCMVHVNGGQLDIKAYDLDGFLFDVLSLTKDTSPPK